MQIKWVLLEEELDRDLRHRHEATDKEGAKSIIEGRDRKGCGARARGGCGERHVCARESATEGNWTTRMPKEIFMAKGRRYKYPAVLLFYGRQASKRADSMDLRVCRTVGNGRHTRMGDPTLPRKDG
jgi:hypothetical protein